MMILDDPIAPVEPVVDTTPEPEYSYEDIHDNTVKEIVEDKVVTPEEKPAETPVTPETPKVEEPDVNKIAEEAARKVLEEQEARAQAQAEADKPKEDEYNAFEKQMWEKEKRQPTYTEALEFVSEQAERRLELKQQERARVAQEQQLEFQKAQEADNQKANRIIDDGLEELYRANMLTRVVDPNNESDPGNVEKRSLAAKWQEVNTQRRAQGLPDITDATRIANYYWKRPSGQVANANAPVMGNKGATTPPGAEQEYSYEDIHKKPWSFFKRG